MSEKYRYRIKYILYATSFIWVMYLVIFSHELGHAVAVISLGGTLHDFVVRWNITGYVLWTGENVPPETIPRVITLVNVSGGIGAALFLIVLSLKSRWFMIPALFCLLDGFAEAMYLADTRFYACNIVGVLVIAICARLFWKFETQHQDNERKQLEQSNSLYR